MLTYLARRAPNACRVTKGIWATTDDVSLVAVWLGAGPPFTLGA